MPQSQLSEKEKVKIAIYSGCHKFRSAKTSNVSGKEHADGVSYSTNVFPFQLDWDITSTFHLYGFLSDFLLLGILSICTPQLGLLLHPFDEGWFGVWQNWGSLVAQMVKNLPEIMWDVQVQSLGQEDALEKGVATHSGILAWRIPWTEEPWWATVHGVTTESDTIE